MQIHISKLLGCLLYSPLRICMQFSEAWETWWRGMTRTSDMSKLWCFCTRAMFSELCTTPRCWQSCNSVWMWSVQVEVHGASWCILVHPGDPGASRDGNEHMPPISDVWFIWFIWFICRLYQVTVVCSKWGRTTMDSRVTSHLCVFLACLF